MKAMTRSLHLRPAFAAAVAVVVAVSAIARPAAAKVTPEQQALVDQVMQRLLAVVEQPEGYDAWPPTWKIIDTDNDGAFASTDLAQRPKLIPIIRIDRGFLEVVAEMNEHRVAYVLGHEIAHLLGQHTLRSRGDTGVTASVFNREDEIEADRVGMQLALKAGYSYRPALGAVRRFIDLGHEYTSFEGVGVSHPSWSDRIALMETDEVQAELWRSMSAFDTGVYFLQTEQNRHAAECFQRVVDEFPKCYEAWANLGYAKLMMYCDALEPQEVREFNIGHLIVGGFYRRAGSLAEQVRGINGPLWEEAVEALEKALALKDDLVLARANLALAYLVHPSGSPDVGEAAREFDAVSQMLAEESAVDDLDPLTRATLLANAWVGVAHNDPAQSKAVMQQIETFLRRAVDQDSRTGGAVQSLRSALGFTRASALAGGTSEADRRTALALFEEYLAAMSPASAWWPLAYERYADTAQALNVTPKPQEELAKRRQNQWRVVSEINLSGDALLGISDPAAEALELLGPADSTTPVVDANLNLLEYGAQGLSVLMGREVIAIVLNSPESPRVELRRPGLGAQPAQIYVGMPRKELEALLGDEWVSQRASVLDAGEKHYLYEDVGVAVQFADGAVSEIIIAQAPHDDGEK
jgi:hypothetical protein